MRTQVCGGSRVGVRGLTQEGWKRQLNRTPPAQLTGQTDVTRKHNQTILGWILEMTWTNLGGDFQTLADDRMVCGLQSQQHTPSVFLRTTHVTPADARTLTTAQTKQNASDARVAPNRSLDLREQVSVFSQTYLRPIFRERVKKQKIIFVRVGGHFHLGGQMRKSWFPNIVHA